MDLLLNFLPAIIIIVVMFGITMIAALYSTYGERKVAAYLQDRHGPNRAGPGGLLQPLADGVKMFLKEEIIPVASNKFLFILGPSIAMTCALMTGVVLPWGDKFTLFGRTFNLQATDLNIGVLYVFAVVSVSVYGIMIGGWASNNKWFGVDKAMTYTAFDIHRQIVDEEGYDPKSDEYYAEIDKRIRLEFPHKFGTTAPTESTKPVQTVASTKRSTKNSRTTVRLTPSQVAIAKKLGVPLEEYAKQLNITKEV